MASELSKQAKSLRDELSSHTLFDATISCLNQDKYGPISDASPEKLIKALSDEMKRNHDTTFLCSSISAIKVDSITVRRAEKWASNGFTIHGKTYQLQRPFNWDTYPGATRNHRYKIQAWLMIDELLRASEIDNRLDFFEIARNVAIDWIDEFIFGQRSDDYAWYDMGTGQRAALLAHITQKSLLTLTSIRNKKRRINLHNDILKLMIACQIHISELMDYERLALHSNHGLFQMSGLLALSKSVPVLSLATEGESFAINGINEMLSDHFFLDGFHKEHSPMYHMYVSNYLHQLEEAMWLPGSNNLSKLAQKAKISVQKYIMPDGFFAPIGDSSLSNRADALCIFPIHKDSNGTPSAPPGIHIFPEGGVAIISTTTKKGVADEHMVFTGQFHSRQHKHADDLSINYCVKGKRYLIDAGTFTYHYDQEERMYVESTRAHNTIEIDGLNSSRFRLDTYGSALKRVIKVGDCTILDGTVHHKRLIQPTIPNNKIKTEDASIVDITHRRIVLHKAQHFMAIIDILDSETLEAVKPDTKSILIAIAVFYKKLRLIDNLILDLTSFS